jgi:multiple antibiotic resistance protein
LLFWLSVLSSQLWNRSAPLAVFATLTKGVSPERKAMIIAKSMRLSFVLLAFFGLTGHLVFQVFNITVAAFQIAGGILLAAVALRMLNPENKTASKNGSEDIAIVPLAIPLTAGPGTITTVILFTSKAQNLIETSFVFIAIFVGVLVSYIGMKYSQRLFKYLGDEGLRVVTAIMAIIVLAIAIQFMIDGAASAVPQI